MLEGMDVSKSYYDRNSRQRFCVLDQCSICINEAEIVGLMGKSGCGKSTLAKILLRLISPDSGTVQFQGQDVRRMKGEQLKAFRRNVQYISQRPENFFDPMMKLETSLMEPIKIHHINASSAAVEEVLALVKLNKEILSRYPHQVSGGEAQRLSIARALLLQPRYLILDEPTSMLDISVQAQVLHILKDIQRDRKLSYLFISHDSAILHWMSDRVLTMKDGVVLEE